MTRHIKTSIAALLAVPAVVILGVQASGSADPSNEPAQIQALRNALADPGLSPQAREALQEKVDAWTVDTPKPMSPSEAKAAKAADRGLERSPWYAEGRAEEAAGRPDRGIMSTKEAPAPSSQFKASNMWAGVLSGRETNVYAGTAGSTNPRDGAVMVTSYDAASGETSGTTLTLAGVGNLRVTGVSGTTATLRAQDGTTHRLDLQAGMWQD